MGLLKKIFKPVSKVLDKIVPNEIKPALPYLAALAPYFGPMQGIMGSGMMQRALMSGGLNIGAQLAQEGSEGDINLLSAGLASLSGAMTAPGTSAGLPKGMSPGESMARYGTTTGPVAGTGSFTSFTDAGIKKYGADSAMGEILGGAAKASKFMTDPGLAKYSIPLAQGTADLMYAEGKRLEDDEEEEVVEEAGYTDAAYRAAIRKSMEAYGATEEEIIAAIEAAGYRSGGRVGYRLGDLVSKSATAHAGSPRVNTGGGGSGLGGMVMNMIRNNPQVLASLNQSQNTPLLNAPVLGESIKFIDQNRNGIDDREETEEEDEFVQVAASGGRVALRGGGDPNFGGIGEAVEKIDDKEMKETMKLAQDMDMPIADLVEEFMIIHKRKPNSLEELKMFYKDKYEYKGPADVKMQETMTERFTAKDGGTPSVLPKGIEADYRGGGFIPIGSKEKADDVPARLSENEFVMTADAVRAAGGGSVNQGAKRMYNLMHNLEARA
jgi:hypothetical protein